MKMKVVIIVPMLCFKEVNNFLEFKLTIELKI